MNDNPRTLAQLLREAGRELDAVAPPAAVWSAVVAAADRSRPPQRRWRPLLWSGAAACVVVLVGSVLLMLQPPADTAAPLAAQHRDGHGSGFLPLLPTDRWGNGPTWVVDAELPAERLAALGLPYDPAHAGEPVRAELLLHASGEVLAVRFVR